MAPTLYMIPPSPPVRAVLMLAKAINLELKHEKIDILNGENLKPEYLKINPVHTVPTLKEDDGFVLWESHAILAYLTDKYATNDALYPKDLRKRAIVNQKLNYDNGVVFSALGRIMRGSVFKGQEPPEEVIQQTYEIYGNLEKLLDSNKWFAGDSLSIADFSLAGTLSSLNVLAPFETKHPKLAVWFKNIQKQPAYEANKEGLEIFRQLVNKKLKRQ